MARRSMAVADIKEILVYWDAGEGVSNIARTLGYSRPTVRKYVRAAQGLGMERGGGRRGEGAWEALARRAIAVVEGRPPPRAAAMEVGLYHDYLEAQVGRVRLSVLHQRLRDEHGLRASWGTFYRYVRAHWPERLPSSPRLTVRLDDPPPGAEAQVDFLYAGRWYDPQERRHRKVYAFLMTLSHSRHCFLYPVLRENQEAWLEGHVRAFACFGGSPRRLVPDNLSAGILKADRYEPRLNRAYGELARYYGCLVDPTRARRPKDHARVERAVDYARESFFRGRTFSSLAEMRQAAEGWCREVAGMRVHGSTGERPLAAFREREADALLPLPPRSWELVTWTQAIVHADCHIQVGRALYSLPYQHVGKRVDVRLTPQTVEVYLGQELLTSHPRREGGRSTRLEHYPEAGRAFLEATPRACLSRARAVGPAAAALVYGLLDTHALHNLRQVQGILRLEERYGRERLERACRRALDHGDGRYRTVRGILEGGLDGLVEETVPPPTTAGAFLRGPETLLAAVRGGA